MYRCWQLLVLCLGISMAACSGGGGEPSDQTPVDGGDSSGPADTDNPGGDTIEPGDTLPGDSGGDVDPGDAAGDTDGGDSTPEAAFDITSFPPPATSVGSTFRYRVVVNKPGSTAFAITGGPLGATIDMNGSVQWSPSASDPAGSYDFQISVFQNGESAVQDFAVHLAGVEVETSQAIETTGDIATTVSVDSPLSPIRGSSVTVPPEALDEETTISIGVVDNPPPLPAAEGNDAAPTVIDFGPSGTVFAEPVSLVLPMSPETVEAITNGGKRPEAWTLGEDGVWERLEIERVDTESGTAVVKAKHFSNFTLVPGQQSVGSGDAARCGEALLIPSGLRISLSDAPATWVNGAPDAWADLSLAEALAAIGDDQQLKFIFQTEAKYDEGQSAGSTRRVVSFSKAAQGFNVVLASAAGDIRHRFDGVSLDSAEVQAALAGDVHHSLLYGAPQSAGAGEGNVYGRIYLGNKANGLGAPPSPGFSFGSEPFAFGSTNTATGDDDCDGVANAYDPTPQGLTPPTILSDEGTLRTIAGNAIDVAIDVRAQDPSAVQLSWTANDPALAITPTSTGASLLASQVGAYIVRVTAEDAGGSDQAEFTVMVDQPPAVNTPPHCRVSSDKSTAWVGDVVRFQATVSDPEQPPEEVRSQWLIPPGLEVLEQSPRALSVRSLSAAEYPVGCVADDGMDIGPASSVQLVVVNPPSNSPPRIDFVQPLSRTVESDAGATGRATISVRAHDHDGDALSMEVVALSGDGLFENSRWQDDAGATSPTDIDWESGALFQTTLVLHGQGAHEVLVRAVDANGEVSDAFVVKVLHVYSLDSLDEDGDGFPASIDCDDSSDAIFPGAPEVCGDGIDQNCSGADRALDDCDLDRDGFSANDGDCDDSNPSVFPGAYERCNGRDDNCNAATDEGYATGAECSLGEGACRATGTLVCAQSGASVVCSATVGSPEAETCNGEDTDCNGVVDDVGAGGSQSVDNCGGCGIACVPQANQIPACTADSAGSLGCTFSCADGYLNIDGDAQNGCEYACTPSGAEVCDGVDNDCDGEVDEGTTEYYYGGDAGTDGVGVCRRGKKVCEEGALVIAQAEVLPQAERCDGVDNDCDGIVDEDFSVGESCDGDDADLCATGATTCSADGLGVVCRNETQRDIRDICDGVDNDCDPSTADGAHDAGLGVDCDGDDSDLCREGVVVCEAGALTCSDTTGDDVDVCDGVDNDCDPSTADGDAEVDLGLSCDGADADMCATGEVICAAGNLQCNDDSASSYEKCDGSGVDADCDGAVDCDDSDCADTPLCIPEVCDDGVDNNGDGRIDCEDPKCFGVTDCPMPPEWCDDGHDNDQDGLVDCADSDCVDDPRCGPEVCGDDHDNDGDGLLDCADDDCAGVAPCGAEDCSDLFDNDGDSFLDCSDSDCAGSAECQPGSLGIGESCQSHNECNANLADPVCIGELFAGFPEGYCSEFCELANDDCGPGGICQDVGFENGLGVCFAGCTDPTECRDAYGCGSFDGPNAAGEPQGPTICLPHCTDDSQCPLAGYCDIERGECTDTIEICGDGVDNDQDGRSDCAEFQCRDNAECYGGAEDCWNGVDDDGDGAYDCEDPDCGSECGPPPDYEDCWNGFDDNGDGLVDCEDPACSGYPECYDLSGEVCDDGTDNEGDGMVDCEDPECWDFCGPPPDYEDCWNGHDDNGDGLTDCADPACANEPICGPEVCDDEHDNDGDGLEDCADDDCAGVAPCGAEECTDAFDNDGDGFMDCGDSDCVGTAECEPGTLAVGEPCSANTECAANAGDPICIGETNIGFPEGYCSEFCDLGADDCAAGSICQDVGFENGQGVCFLACTDGSECRNAYGCDVFEGNKDPAGQPAGETVCLPYCTSDADCPSAGYCDFERGQCTDTIEICGDGVDNDQDGRTDCAEFQCRDNAECYGGAEDCWNGIDDDGDGAYDCEDPDCGSECGPPPDYEDCWNGVDDNGNGLVDCEDPVCAGAPECNDIRGEVCDDGADNEGDGMVDCEDPECWDFCGPPPDYEDCWNGVDDNGDGLVDCEDPVCAGAPECNDVSGEICDDGTDNEGDGMVDCEDPECWDFCGPPPDYEDCWNGVDDNGDGLADCADPACANEPICGPEVCDDEHDNDGDGLADCADDDCAGFILCGPEACDDFFDNDGDGAFDCDDADCAGVDPACAVGTLNVGEPCTSHNECLANAGDPLCAGEVDPGFPGGYCTEFCDLATNDCAAGATCTDVGFKSGSGVCLKDCASDTECRAEYACYPGSDKATQPSCMPACTDDSQCPDAGYCDLERGWCTDAIEICGDGIDNDQDGRTDCAEFQCRDNAECYGGAEDCWNGIDDDGDGAYDCEDPDCGSECGPPPDYEDCWNGVDDNGDGLVDCEDPVCAGAPECNDISGEVCDDGTDNEGDGMVDCEDPECWGFCGPPPDYEDCWNGVDDNGDGLVDCEDPVCAGAPECNDISGEVCDDGTDNEGDGMVDCEDPECWDFCGPPPDYEDCWNGVDDNGDGLVDCEDPACSGYPECYDLSGEICDDGTDNEGDGMVDCEDPECWDFCGPPPDYEDCWNGVDDNGDGLVDCEDPACASDPACGPEICDDEYDNDGDGLEDCADDECAGFILCGVEVCDDFFDNDGDGAFDCDDVECAANDPICTPGTLAVGEPCSSHSECAANANDPVCAGEIHPGMPGGYCTEFCDLAVDDCAPGSVCTDVGLNSGSGVCFLQCQDSTECRPGYACEPFDGVGELVCDAACTDDSQCPQTGYCDIDKGMCALP